MRPNHHMLAAAIDHPQVASFDEDIALVSHILSGDERSFDALYHKYYDKVFGIARGILLDPEEAADATQEIFTLVYRNLARFDRRSRFTTWLFRIAVNRSIQESRKNRNFKKSVALSDEIPVREDQGDDLPDPEVQSALMQLSPGDRAILTLFYWQELSLNEISSSMGCASNAAKTRLYRARERFRALYEESR